MANGKRPSFVATPTMAADHSGIGEISLPMYARSFEGEFWASGTATVISPWLAITARHVVEDFLQRFGSSAEGDAVAPQFHIGLVMVLAAGRGVRSLFAGRIWYSQPIDIAVLELVPANNDFARGHDWKLPVLDLSPPLVGTQVVAVGYPTPRIDPAPDRDGAPVGIWRMTPATSTGVVEELHLEFRDKSLLPFPSFRTNARFDGGMSGAPVFNDAGHVCGIVCSGIAPMAEEDGHISYASVLWPMMGIRMNKGWEGHPDGEYYLAFDLASAKEISTVGLERIHISDANGVRTVGRQGDPREYPPA
jgi:hypothetical protein